MSAGLWILLYLLIGFQHSRLWARRALAQHDDEMLTPIWLIGFPCWPAVDAVWACIILCQKFPGAAKRLVVASPPRSEKKQLKRKELESRVSELKSRNAELERELELDP